MLKTAALILILGLTFAVFTQVAFLESRDGFTTRMFDGDTHRPEWSGRTASAGVAKLVHADGHAALWTAGWFLLSAGAWFVARGQDCIAPVAVLAAGTLATFYPQVGVGTVASEGPILFWFTLAAVTRRDAFFWWPVIGLVAIPFKQTGVALVIVAAALWLRDGRWRGAGYLLGAGALVGWVSALAGGGCAANAFTTHSLSGKFYPLDNLRHATGAWWPTWLICGGTVLAGAFAARGAALAAVLILVVAVSCMGQAWEPRIWVEVVALSAGVLGDRGGSC